VTMISKRRREWEQSTLEPVLKRFPERQTFTHSWGEPVARFNTPEDTSTSDEQGYLEQLGFPGEYPYTRGVQPCRG